MTNVEFKPQSWNVGRGPGRPWRIRVFWPLRGCDAHMRCRAGAAPRSGGSGRATWPRSSGRGLPHQSQCRCTEAAKASTVPRKSAPIYIHIVSAKEPVSSVERRGRQANQANCMPIAEATARVDPCAGVNFPARRNGEYGTGRDAI